MDGDESIQERTMYRCPSLKKSASKDWASQTVSCAVRCDFLVPSRASITRRTRNPRTSRGGYRSCAGTKDLVGAITTAETSSTHGKFLLEPFNCAVTRRLSVLLCQGEHGVDLAIIELPNDGLLVRRRLDAVKDLIRFFGGCALIISGSAQKQRMHKMGQHHARDISRAVFGE